MPRIVCAWAPFWPIDRLTPPPEPPPPGQRRTGAALDDRDANPFALVHTQAQARRLSAVNPAAAALGLHRGQPLAGAQAIAPRLRFQDADPEGDCAALQRLGVWALRYSPWVHARQDEDGSGVLAIDIAGSEPLFGGEAALAHDLKARLLARGVRVHAAIASTLGAAYALARYGCGLASPAGAGPLAVPPGEERAALARLPVEALRCGETADALRRAGLKHVGDVLRLGRQALTARFGARLPLRLDQALGRAPEPLEPLTPPLSHRAQLAFLEPLTHQEAALAAAAQAARDLCGALAARGLGARRMRLSLHRTDGRAVRLDAGCATPSHDAAHIARLFRERMKAAADEADLGLGVEALTLEAEAEPAPARQHSLDSHAEADEAALDLLIDRLGSRLSLARIQRLTPQDSHIPERAVIARAAGRTRASGWDKAPPGEERPLLMLPAAEPAEAIAEIPDGPPKRFRWRRTLYEAARAEGPERIAPEWWRAQTSGPHATRDYYRVEDTHGRRFWLYREGLYGNAGEIPRWFVHGVFA